MALFLLAILLLILFWFLIILLISTLVECEPEEVPETLLKGFMQMLALPAWLIIAIYLSFKATREKLEKLKEEQKLEAEKLLNLEVEELTKEINDCISSWEESLESYLLVSSLFCKLLRFEEKYGLTTLDKLKEKLSDLTIKFENR